jgi:hypothetical protein
LLLHRLTHMVSCREASRLLSQREERALTRGERLRLHVHLAVCTACRRFARQLAFLRAAMAAYRARQP